MGLKKGSIQTGVDKLVSLVDEYGKISYKAAAKKLAVPVSTIEEWAHILEEEHVVETDYRLGSPIIVRKELSETQKKAKLKQFSAERDLFNHKLEAASSYFNELDKKINRITEVFSNMEGTVERKLRDVNKDIAQLSQAEAEKENLDKQIIEAKRRSQEKLKEVEQHLHKSKIEYERSFSAARQELSKDQTLLQKSENFLDKMKKEEVELQKRLKNVQDMSAQIQKEIELRAKTVSQTEEHVNQVQSKHNSLKKELEEQHKSLQVMLKQNEEQVKIISNLQVDLTKKMDSQEKSLANKEKELRSMPSRFKDLFERKRQIHDLLSVISHEEVELKDEIENLKKQAHLMQFSIGTKQFGKEVEAMNKKMNDITSKRAFFKTKLEKLTSLLNWENGK